MKKAKSVFFVLMLLFVFPITYLTFGKYLNFDTLSAIIFLLVIIILVVKNRKKLDFQILLRLFKIPVIYAVLWKTKFGLRFMEKVSNKYQEFIKLLGYCFIGFGFVGMILISINILFLLFKLFISPRQASQGVSLVLPLTNIPGLGYLSFWHFLITIFITALIHEFAHGIVARAHNVPVKASGLGIFSLIVPLFPLAFVEPDEKKLKKEKDIVQYSIFSAGPMVNIIFALVILLFMSYAVTPLEQRITHPVGFSFNGLMDNYSAKEAGMNPGMIINSVNGEETLDYQTFSKKIGILKPGQELTLGTNNGTFSIITKPSPQDPEVGYIGILSIANERRMNEEYLPIKTPFFWIKDLIKWLYFINIAIGLINLLPLMVTDGGRMLKTAFEKLFRDRKNADKAWMFVGVIFIFTLLFALTLRYSLSLFSFLSG